MNDYRRDIRTANVEPTQSSVSGFSPSGVTDPTFRPDYDPTQDIFGTLGKVLGGIKQGADENAFLRGAADRASTAKAMGDVADDMGRRIEEESMFTRDAYVNGSNYADYMQKSLEAQTELSELASKHAGDPKFTMEMFTQKSKEVIGKLNRHIEDTGMYGEGADKARTSLLGMLEVSQKTFAGAQSAAAINKGQQAANQAAGGAIYDLDRVPVDDFGLYGRTLYNGLNQVITANLNNPGHKDYATALKASGTQIEAIIAQQLQQVETNVSDPDAAKRLDGLSFQIAAQLQDPKSPMSQLPASNIAAIQAKLSSTSDTVKSQRATNFQNKINNFNYGYTSTGNFDYTQATDMEEEINTFFNMRWINEKDYGSLLKDLRTNRADANKKMGYKEFYRNATAEDIALRQVTDSSVSLDAQAEAIVADSLAMGDPDKQVPYLLSAYRQTKNTKVLTQASKLMYNMAAPLLTMTPQELADPMVQESLKSGNSVLAFKGWQNSVQDAYRQGNTGMMDLLVQGAPEADRDAILEVMLDPTVQEPKDIYTKLQETKAEIANFSKNTSKNLGLEVNATESYWLGRGEILGFSPGTNPYGSGIDEFADDAATEQRSAEINRWVQQSARRVYIQSNGNSAPVSKNSGMVYAERNGLIVKTGYGAVPTTPDMKQALSGGAGRELEPDVIAASFGMVMQDYVATVGANFDKSDIVEGNVKVSVIGEGPSAVMVLQSLDAGGSYAAPPVQYTVDQLKAYGNATMMGVKGSASANPANPIKTGAVPIPTQGTNIRPNTSLNTYQDTVVGNNEIWVAATSHTLQAEGFNKTWKVSPRADGEKVYQETLGPGITKRAATAVLGEDGVKAMTEAASRGDMETFGLWQHKFAQGYYKSIDLQGMFAQAGLPPAATAGNNKSPYVTLMDVAWYRPADAWEVAKAMRLASSGNITAAEAIVDGLETTKADKNGKRIQGWRATLRDMASQQYAAR